MSIHLDKGGKAKCGATSWRRWSAMEITKDKSLVNCKRCLGTVKRTVQSAEIKGDMVGKIFHTSWGYDMTINEYARVIKQSSKSILLQECYKITNGESYYPGGTGKARTSGELKPNGEKFRLFKKTRTYNDWKTGEPITNENWAGGGECRYWSEWDGQSSYENTCD